MDPTALLPPTIGPPSISAARNAGRVDVTIAYPAPAAGSNPVLGVALCVATGNPKGPYLVPTINVSAEAGTFEQSSPVGSSAVLAVVAFDDARPPTVSEPAFEPLVGDEVDPKSAARLRDYVRDFLAAELTPERLADLAALSAAVRTES